MNPKDAVVIVFLAIIIGLAVFYIVRQKKKGIKCIGCPSAGCCPSGGRGECSTLSDRESNNS